jgi:hypothetical protein
VLRKVHSSRLLARHEGQEREQMQLLQSGLVFGDVSVN